MRRLLAFVGGILSGGAIGTAAALLLTPASGDRMRTGLRQHYREALEAGHEAAEQKRMKLEAQFVAMTGPHSPDSALVKPDSANVAR